MKGKIMDSLRLWFSFLQKIAEKARKNSPQNRNLRLQIKIW